MNQQIAYKLLTELGGNDIPSKPINHKALMNLCREKYPTIYYDKHITMAINRLKKWNYISFHYRRNEYTIVERFPEPNKYVIPLADLGTAE